MTPNLSHLGLVTVGTEAAWAVTSPDDAYRYVLGRMWHPGLPYWLFCMLNPSTARVKDDPTITKLRGFVSRHRGGGFMVVNTMAYSETQPKELALAAKNGIDVIGEHNGAVIAWAIDAVVAGRRVAAWGKVPPSVRGASAPCRAVFLSHGVAGSPEPECFGTNEDGSPCHPLYLGYDTPIVPYGRRAA
jgi:hypothetical protein